MIIEKNRIGRVKFYFKFSSKISAKYFTLARGFTLIELLIVVAILGILAAVAIPQFQGYQNQAKINASRGIHNEVLSLIVNSFTNCSAGAGNVTLGTLTTACTSSAATFAADFATYFAAINMSNPYTNAAAVSVVGSAGTTPGNSYLVVSGNTVTITTVVSASDSIISLVVKE